MAETLSRSLVRKTLDHIRRVGFTPVEEMERIKEGPLIYVLHEGARCLHPNPLISLTSDIAHIQRITSVREDGGGWVLGYTGLFGYWALDEVLQKPIYLGGGNIQAKTASMRTRYAFPSHCFTGPEALVQEYFPLDENAHIIRI
jgi:hypothetical protein